MKKTAKKLIIIGLFSLIVSLINRIIFMYASMKDYLHQSSTYHYQWKFGKIFYTVQGEGTPILLIHSLLPGSSSYEFTKLSKQLAKSYRVYTLDLLGYGQSDKPKMTYTAYLFVQLISDFSKEVIGTPTSIITSGKSNAFATMACYQNSNLFNKLIFINPTPIFKLNQNPRNKDKFLKFILETPFIGTSLYNIIHSHWNIERLFYRNYFKNSLRIRRKYVNAFYEGAHLGLSGNKFTFSSEFCKYNNVNIIDALSHINNSLYIIQGVYTEDDFESVIKTYKDINPAIETSTVDGVKTFPHLEKPDSTQEILTIYLHE